MDKSNIYLDLIKLSEEQIKSLPQIIGLQDEYLIDFMNTGDFTDFYDLHFNKNNWNISKNIEDTDKTEIQYPEFIKLFEGGESKEVLQVEDKITYENRYSDDENSDDMGRWSRKAFYKDLCIGWINKLETERGVFFSLSTFFPLTGNDSPTKHELHPTYEKSQSSLEKLWFEFLENIKSNQ